MIIDSQLNYNDHVQDIVKSGNRMVGFLIRICHFFKNKDTILTLYNGLVRSKLEYGSVIWNSFQSKQIEAVEKVQKKFLRYLYFKTNGIYPHYNHHPVSTAQMLVMFNICSLKKRRDV